MRMMFEDTAITAMPELRFNGAGPLDAIFSDLRTGTYDEIADYLTNGYWEWSGFVPHKWDVSPGGTVTFNVTRLTSEAQTLAREAFRFWSDVANITFQEISGVADISFDDNDDGAYASTSVDGNGFIVSSDINVDVNWHSGIKTLNSYTFQTYIHEIGHALGLGHSGPYNGTASFGADAVFANDSWQASIMSYFSQADNPNIRADDAFVMTPMMADIVAIQNLYGAQQNTRSGDTVYGYNSNAGSIYDADVFGSSAYYYALSYTIYDTGGIDTLDYSKTYRSQVIDLRPEGISSVLGAVGNVVIARGVIIENAKSGSGNDTITGNEANNNILAGEGDDIIYGGAGDDVLEGQRGNDVIQGGDGNDLLLGGVGADTLEGGDGDDQLGGDADNDVLIAGPGRDSLDGGAGTDIARFSYDYTEYTITRLVDGSLEVVHTGGNGLDGYSRLQNIEYMEFSDRFVQEDFLDGPLDVVLIQDLTDPGYYSDKLDFIKSDLSGIFDSINGQFSGSRFAAASFKDVGDDYTYRVELDFSESFDSLKSTYAGYSMSGGGDNHDAQLTALMRAASGEGVSYTPGHTRLLILTTNSPFHDYEDIGALRALLEAGDIVPMFVVASYDFEYRRLVEDLGRGAVVRVESDFTNYADVVRYGIAQLKGALTQAAYKGWNNDTLDGTEGEDGIFGLRGHDTINGYAGNDLLDGGSGDDLLFGGDGLDTLHGGSGNDKLNGEAGSDTVEGGTGDDILFGGRGFDALSGGQGDDRLSGGRGLDILRGGEGDDRLEGGQQADKLYGNAGIDTVTYANSSEGVRVDLETGRGAGGDAQGDRLGSIENLVGSNFGDSLSGDGQANVLSGLNGGDKLEGWGGNDRLDGGRGADILNGGGGDDQILGRSGADIIYGGAGNDVIDAGENDDVVVAGSGADTVLGGEGQDRLFGNEDDDTLRGNGGDDLIVGNAGNDVLFGGTGNDDLRGGQGDDTLSGGEGDDVLVGFSGTDYLNGHSGTDIAVFDGRQSDYTIVLDGGSLIVMDKRAGRPDSMDVLASIEILRFADGDVAASDLTAMSLSDPLVQIELSDALAEFGISPAGLSDMVKARMASFETALAERSGELRDLYPAEIQERTASAVGSQGLDSVPGVGAALDTDEGYVNLDWEAGMEAARTVSSLEAFEDGFIPASGSGVPHHTAPYLAAIRFFGDGAQSGATVSAVSQHDLSQMPREHSEALPGLEVDEDLFWF